MRCINGLVTELLPNLPIPMRLHLCLAGSAHQMNRLALSATADPNIRR